MSKSNYNNDYMSAIEDKNFKSSKLNSFGIFLISIVIILIRYPSYILSPRIWAEEYIYIETFHSMNLIDGFNALLYPSYYVFLSRMAGYMSTLFDPTYYAVFNTLFGMCILLIPISIICFTNSKYWNTLYKKVLLCMFLIFSCSTGEIWLNSTNIGFIMPVATFLILIDENISSTLKIFTYSIIIFLAALTGPISLMMAPFFFLKLISMRKRGDYIFCMIFFFTGIFQLTYFYISSNIDSNIMNANRGIFSNELSFINQFYYLISPNIIFPFLGYFIASIFRNTMILFNNPSADFTFLKNFFSNTENEFLSNLIFSNISNISFLLNIFTFLIFSTFIILLLRRMNRFEIVYFFILFFYLSILINMLSLGGHGGYRYSYLTSFIVLFYLLSLSLNSKSIFPKVLISLSILIGIIEYYPRVISFTPEYSIDKNYEWPIWSNEIQKWKKDPSYKPKIWPYLKKSKTPFPNRNSIWSINLNEPEAFNTSGQKFLTKEFKRLITE